MYRVELTARSTGKKKVDINTVVTISPNYDELVRTASNKLKIPTKKIRLFVKNSMILDTGLEITDQTDMEDLLRGNQTIVSATRGEEFRGKSKNGPAVGTKRFNDLMHRIGMPPGYPFYNLSYEDSSHNRGDNQMSDTPTSSESTRIQPIECIEFDEERKNIFPTLEGNVLNTFRNAVKDTPNLTEVVHYDFSIFDYKDKVEYSKDSHIRSIQNECRGIVICNRTGRVLARRFHKFYNIGEISDTLSECIADDFHSIRVFEKMDGSLVSPIMLNGTKLIWATRRQRSEDVEVLANELPGVNDFARYMLGQDITPLFEHCVSSNAPGLLFYEQDKLVLLALRHNITGQYIPIDSLPPTVLDKIETVNELHFDSYQEMARDISKRTNLEGVVLYHPSGRMYKFKTDWWVSVTRANKIGGSDGFLPEILGNTRTLKGVPTHQVWLTALRNTDDVISNSVMSIDDPTEQKNFIRFVEIIQRSIQRLKTDLVTWAKDSYNVAKAKEPIMSVAESVGLPRKIVNDALNSDTVGDELLHVLLKLAKKRKVRNLEEILDVSWDSDNVTCYVTNTELDVAVFDTCDDNVRDHVLCAYLPRKLSQILGVKEVLPDTVINLPRNYQADEGKIIGMHERFNKQNVWDLRIDLQPSVKGMYTAHNGNAEYALLLVQHGLFSNPDSRPHGEFAGVLIPTESVVTVKKIVDGMRQSFELRKLIKIRRIIDSRKTVKIFCDLDGVLADFEAGVQRVTGRGTRDQTVSKMWSRVLSHPGFFSSLDWTKDGEKLWDFIKEYKPTILTGLPYSCKNTIRKDKIRWCNQKLGADIDVITCNSNEKHRYANYGDILIDDRLENMKSWKALGGVFIHHISAERTIYELKRHCGLLSKVDANFPLSQTEVDTYQVVQPIETILTYLPSITEGVVGVDIEWDSHDLTNSISTVQIATSEKVYVIDMLNCTEVVKEELSVLLTDPNVIKLFFDASNQDIMRLQSDLINVIDFREWGVDTLTPIWQGDFPSLNILCRIMLDQQLQKELRMSSWDTRPLSMAQLEYAAGDAASLLDLYDVILSEERFTNPTRQNIYLKTTSKKSLSLDKNEYDPSIPTKVIYAGVFLTNKSRQLLLNTIKPGHSKTSAEHLTLLYEPGESDLRGFPISQTCVIRVDGTYSNSDLQCVRAWIGDNPYHITISTASGVPPSECNDVLSESYEDLQDGIDLTGTYGLLVTYDDDPLVIFTEKTRNRVRDFTEKAQIGESLRFKPNELSSGERLVLHEYADQNGLKSESSGKKGRRKLTLTKIRNGEKIRSNLPIYEHANDEKAKEKKVSSTFRITDLNVFESINFVQDGRAIRTHGSIGGDRIRWNGLADDRVKLLDDIDNSITPMMVVLRGLPGSGKSSLARILAGNSDNITVCSADQYFETKNGYEFSKDDLGKAHEFCYDRCREALESNRSAIVDNTNSRLSEYQKYLDLADEFDVEYQIIEVVCRDREQGRIFSERTTHMVPHRVIIQMMSRWETDDRAILVSAYDGWDIQSMFGNNDNNDNNDNNEIIRNTNHEIGVVQNNTFQQYLTDNRLFHSSKKRNRSHLWMAVNNRPNVFLDVPTRSYREFLLEYLKSGLNESDEPKYLVELPGKRFRMFFDVDFTEVVSTALIIKICRIVQNIIPHKIYVSGHNENHTGVHLKIPDYVVNYNEAIDIHSRVVASNTKLDISL